MVGSIPIIKGSSKIRVSIDFSHHGKFWMPLTYMSLHIMIRSPNICWDKEGILIGRRLPN